MPVLRKHTESIAERREKTVVDGRLGGLEEAMASDVMIGHEDAIIELAEMMAEQEEALLELAEMLGGIIDG